MLCGVVLMTFMVMQVVFNYGVSWGTILFLAMGSVTILLWTVITIWGQLQFGEALRYQQTISAIALGTVLAFGVIEFRKARAQHYPLGNHAPFLLAATLDQARDDLINQVSLYPEPVAGFVQAVVLGERRSVGYQLREVFRVCGTLHLLVVSGLHVSLVASVFSGLLTLPLRFAYAVRLLRLPTWLPLHILAIYLSCAMVWIFAIFSGFGAPAQRAAIVFSLFKLTPLLCGHLPVGLVLAVAALIHLIVFDHHWWDVPVLLSWLSYLLFIGLACHFSARASTPFYRFKWLLLTQLAAGGLVLILLGNFSPVGVFYNLIVTPLFFLVLLASFAWLLGISLDWFLVASFSYEILSFFLSAKIFLAKFAEGSFFVAGAMSLPIRIIVNIIMVGFVATILLKGFRYMPISLARVSKMKEKGV